MLTNVSGVYENNKGSQIYVEGLKRYQKRGIRVLIDGKDACEETAKGSCIIVGRCADYILEDIPQENTAKGEVNEEEEDYMKAKRLKEIHFDIVYHQ